MTRLVNTRTAETLLASLPAILAAAREAFERRRQRRAEIRKPEWFGTTLHIELAD